MLKIYRILFIFLLISSQALSYPFGARRNIVVVNQGTSGKIDYPDDVKAYVNRLEQCYKLKRAGSSNLGSLEQAQIAQLQCSNLQQDSQNMHYIYYQNTQIIEYINKYEKSYPFFGN